MQPEAYPIQSLWSPRLGVQARVEFRFYTSLDVPSLSTLHINTGIYNILQKEFELYNQPRATVVPTTLWRLVGNDARYIIEKDVQSLVPHRVRFYTVAPTDVSQGNGYFLLEFTDEEATPICTQDGLTEGFQLAVEMDFRVSVERSPPSTLIPLKLNINPKGSRPTEFNFVSSNSKLERISSNSYFQFFSILFPKFAFGSKCNSQKPKRAFHFGNI